MVHFISPRVWGLIGLILSTVSPFAHGDHEAREGLTCGLGHSFDFDFCYDDTLLSPGLPMAGYAYVLTTEDRAQFITVSITESDMAPNLDVQALQDRAGGTEGLPLGPAYVFSSTISLTDGDADAYSATLEGPGDFGFTVQAVRAAQVSGGIVRVSLIDTRADADETSTEALEAFAEVTSTFRSL